jgi:hypothetical protein
MRTAWNICTYIPVSGLKHANLHHVHAALTVSKVVCGSIKLGCGLGSHSSPSSLPPPCDQHTTLRCLPFTPATPLTFFTWQRPGVTAVLVLTSTGSYCYYTLQNHHVFSLLFLRNNNVGRTPLLYIPKTPLYFCFFFYQKQPFQEYCGVRTKNSERLMQENDTSKNDASNIITHCLHGRCIGTRKMNDTCG